MAAAAFQNIENLVVAISGFTLLIVHCREKTSLLWYTKETDQKYMDAALDLNSNLGPSKESWTLKM